jgi:hypothetical protein
VHHDERAVLAQVQVELDLVQALALGADEGAQGVLGLDAHHATVADGEEAHGRQPRPRRTALRRTPGDGTPTI